MKLTRDFYLQDDVVLIAKQLIGKILFTKFENQITAGIITETEAYNGIIDKASHAYNDRRTARTEIMYSEGGLAYIYLCYGVHSLFNVVTNREGIPHAVLVRAVQPYKGIRTMELRRNKKVSAKNFSNGPGTVSQALGIHYSATGLSLLGNKIWIEDQEIIIPKNKIIAGPRVGVDYAGKDAFLPYRFTVDASFTIKNNMLNS